MENKIINIGKFTINGKDVLLKENKNGCLECISHCKDNSGYTRIQYNGKQDRLFRVLYEKKYGEISVEEQFYKSEISINVNNSK